MTKPRFLAALLAATLSVSAYAGEPAAPAAKPPEEPAAAPAKAGAKPETEKTTAERAATEARVRALLAQRALEKTTQSTAPAVIAPAAAITAAPAAEAVTTLPGLEVKGARITEIDIQIRKLEKDIAREKKKMKSSDLDKSLNDPALAKSVSLFGGKSTEQRESVAADRVNLMEAERDILEAMKQARTKADVAMYQQKIDDLKELRRNLDTLYR